MKISILGLNKAVLLEALYDGALYEAPKFDSQPAIRAKATEGTISPIVKSMLAEQFIKEKNQANGIGTYQFDTVNLGEGERELSIDLSGFEIDVTEYDELHGEGKAQKIISTLYGLEREAPHETNVKKDEKNIFYATIHENTDWLPAALSKITQANNHLKKNEKEFLADLNQLILGNAAQEKYEKKPDQAIYLTWLKLLDPKIDCATKEKCCEALAKAFVDDQEGKQHKLSIGGHLSYMPAIVSAPILLYSPTKVLAAYYEYQNKYREYSHKLCDLYFQRALCFLISTDLFPKESKITFLKKIMEIFKKMGKNSYFMPDENYLLNEAMATWEKDSLLPALSVCFDQALKEEYQRFEKTISDVLKSQKITNLNSTLECLIFKKLLNEYQYHAELLTPVVMHFHQKKDIQTLVDIYESHHLNPSEMLKRHLIELSRLTNEPNGEFSALFFSTVLSYLGEEAKSIAAQIASSLSSDYYVKNDYAFDEVKKELFTIWLDRKPEQIIAIVKAILAKPKESHQTPADEFFFELSYLKMKDDFYDKLVALIVKKLDLIDFIKLYSAASEKIQHKLLSELLHDREHVLENLKQLNILYQSGNFSLVFLRKIVNQLKVINPELYEQIEDKKIFVSEEIKDDLETDLSLLKRILENTSLSHDERRSEMRKLENLHQALKSKEIETCPVVIKMFNRIPKKNWPDLFTYFTAEIVHWSFPQDEAHLALFYPDKSKRPTPRKDTWLLHQEEWENILQGTLVEILAEVSKHDYFDLRGNVAHWALSALDEAFTKSSIHFPGLVDRVLKTFFLSHLPKSIELFIAIQDKFRDKYHAPTYFSEGTVYNQVASWLPEDTLTRVQMLAQLLLLPKPFSQALKIPFVRSRDEIALIAHELINMKPIHLVNFFDRLPSDISAVFFKELYRYDGEEFLNSIKIALSDVAKSSLSSGNYLKFTLMLLYFSDQAHIDIFNLMDDHIKTRLLATLSDSLNVIDNATHYYKLLFKIIYHYQPEQFANVVFEQIKKYIERGDLDNLCYCIEDALKVINRYSLKFSSCDTAQIVKFLTEKIAKALDYFSQTTIKVMSYFIPNFDELLLELMAKEIIDGDDLSDKYTECLDHLVKIYGYDHINTLCLNLKLSGCSAYLVNKFSLFPDLLNQIDKATETYQRFFDAHDHILDRMTVWRFNDNLRSAMIKRASSSKMDFNIDIAVIAEKSGIPSQLITLMPLLKLEGANVPSLITTSWQRSGLLKSPIPLKKDLPHGNSNPQTISHKI